MFTEAVAFWVSPRKEFFSLVHNCFLLKKKKKNKTLDKSVNRKSRAGRTCRKSWTSSSGQALGISQQFCKGSISIRPGWLQHFFSSTRVFHSQYIQSQPRTAKSAWVVFLMLPPCNTSFVLAWMFLLLARSKRSYSVTIYLLFSTPFAEGVSQNQRLVGLILS